MIRRRQWFKTALAAVGAFGASRSECLLAGLPELTLPDDVPTQAFDFESGSLEGWTTVNGRWVVEEMPGAPSGTTRLAVP